MEEIIQPIRQDRLNGMTYREIGEKYHIDPRTAKRYAQNNLPLSQLEQRPFSSILDPYKPFIDSTLAKAPVPASTIYNWIVELGYTGKYRIVAEYVRRILPLLEKQAAPRVPPGVQPSKVPAASNPPPDHPASSEQVKNERKAEQFTIGMKAEKESHYVADLKY